MSEQPATAPGASGDASLLARVATGALDSLVDQAGLTLGKGAWVDALVTKGRAIVTEDVEDEAVASGLHAALDVLASPEARSVLASTTQGAFTALAVRLGMGTRGEARAEYIRNHASFEERHAMLMADTEDAVAAKDRLMSLVSSVESVAIDVLAKGGAAAGMFLVGLL